MPELPEVETVRRGLIAILESRPVIERVVLNREDIRFPIPKNFPARLKNQPILGVSRRAKYLIFETPEVLILSHLGMTGSWRLAPQGEEMLHDHCYIELRDGRRLAYCDPRRFGILDLIEIGGEAQHPRLKHLGPEPLDEIAFNGEFLFAKSRKRDIAIKTFIMDQKVVVGVGNIYASEVLFRAKIRPQRKAGKIRKADAEDLVQAIRDILCTAILAGGSTIRDFKSTNGSSGYFQQSHQVYDRGGELCRVCETKLRSSVVGGRSTFWCPTCQK